LKSRPTSGFNYEWVRGQVLFFAIFYEGNYEAVYRGGYKLKEVGEFLGIHYSRVSRIASRVAKSKT
jgi:hypothetical protein